jgi:FkbH-like protein
MDSLSIIKSSYMDRTYTEYVILHEQFLKEKVDLPTYKIAILRNCTIEPILPILSVEMFLLGYKPVFYICDYDAIAESALNKDSSFYAFNPDLIFVIQWLDNLSQKLTTKFLQHTEIEIESELNRVVDFTLEINQAIRSKTKAPVVFNNFSNAQNPTLGILDAQNLKWQRNTIALTNREILNGLSKSKNSYILDIERIISKYGSNSILSQREWNTARLPFSKLGLIKLALEYTKFFKSLIGKQKKCLVLDCDNTLWGGVLGEEGISGIKFGQTYPGSVYYGLQEEILNLHARGVIIALCSKNNESDVMDAFNQRSDFLLKKEHLATWRINWNSKADNLREIASELNIGLDSMVFIDDSDFEIGLVQNTLPEVSAIKLDLNNISTFKSNLIEIGYFDSLNYTSEDKNKNQAYIENRARIDLQNKSLSLEDYLISLDIKVSINKAHVLEYERCAQLSQKTNQFNLTTKRYTENDLEEIVKNGGRIYRIRASDKVSELGIIGLVILVNENKNTIIDTFLLSCRALGRGIENAVLSRIVDLEMVIFKPLRLVGQYIETKKNSQVKDFYSKLGFTRIESRNDSDSALFLLDDFSQKPTIPKWIAIQNE